MSGTHNWLPFDSLQNGMMNDADYAADSERQNGVVAGLATPTLYNKTTYQANGMAYAIAQCVADAGLSIIDSDLVGLVAALKQTFGALTGNSIKTGAFSPGVANKGTAFTCNTSSFAATFAASATLGNNWYCWIRNNAAQGSGINITLTPNGAETIRGATSIVLGPGSEVMVYSDGSNLHAMGKMYYQSAPQTLTAAGLLTLAHGLGVRPKVVQASLVCVTTDNNYSVGDVILVDLNSTASSTNRFNSLTYDATNIKVRYTSTVAVFDYADKTSGGAVSLTNANWNLVIDAAA